ncbi:MAG: FIST signal transduction protein, partial [Pseudohongiellaceae bacterium]
MQLETYQYLSGGGWNSPLNEQLDTPSTLVLVFGSPNVRDIEMALGDVSRTFQQSVVMGCSTAGEIFHDLVCDHSLSVAVACFAHTRLKAAGSAIASSEESFFAGQSLVKDLDAPDLRGVIILSEGLVVNGSKLIEAFSPLAERGVVVTGGLAGDGSRFDQTWTLCNENATRNHVCAVGLYGDAIQISHGSRGGWDIMQSELTVTHAIGNVLYEINDEPALEVYKRLMGDEAAGLPSSGLRYPLALVDDEAEDGYTVRTILAIDEVEQSITFASEIPDEAKAHLMSANFSRLVEGARMAAHDATTDRDQNVPVLSIAISCLGRRLVLGEGCNEELQTVLNTLPANSH